MALNITVQEVAEYLGIDPDEVDQVVNNNLSRQISAAESYLSGAIGKDYDGEDPRVKELGIMIAAELYNSRGVTSARQDAAIRRIATDFFMQLRLERDGDD
nr:head-tail connector protein [uncultured Ruminococcus sp.]